MKTSFIFNFLLFLVAINNVTNAQSISLQTIATGIASPVDIKHAGDQRLFVVEQDGKIKIIDVTGANAPTTFLDISNLTNASGERGLLSVAFHPNYSTNGKFYVNYTNLSGSSVIAQYNVSASNPNLANPNGTILLSFTQPFSNHNGGCLQFGPDGFLYIASGDGGSAGDPGNRSQNINTLLGKLLRIDVDNPSANLPYGIPSTNPYATTAGADEIYSIGLRNPWKFAFDFTTNDLWIADVGQDVAEETNRIPYTINNANYGWRCYEGNAPFNANSNCPPDSQLIFPVAPYNHSGNGAFKCSVTGGYVYRGTSYPNFQGKYFFADFCSDEIGTVTTTNGVSTIAFLQAFPNQGLSTFGEDVNKELYVAGLISGTIYKITDATAGIKDEQPFTATLTPNPASNVLTLNTSSFESQSLKLYDLNGRLMLETQVLNNQQIDISTLSTGIYLAVVASNKDSQTFKIIKQD